MTRYWSGLVAAGAMAITVGLGAQAQNPANTPPPDAAAPPGVEQAPAPPSAQDRTPNTITVTGCVANAPGVTASAGVRGSAGGVGAGVEANAGGDTTASGQAGAAGARAEGQAAAGATTPRFVLSGATITAGGEPARGVVGTTGSAAMTYQLEGDATTISPHLNHRVEITGRLQSSAASPTGAANAAPGSTAAGPTLRVESVRMLSETCDPATAAPPTGDQNRNPGVGNQGNPQPNRAPENQENPQPQQ